ncbi:phage portal protein [Clostridium sp. C8-1-8]|uniref:phage portal protein n=1 Tax=Clostridium sp. C8-1-8 TaxID=2698831 RepID=UPI0013681B24|nr:phage portal protein [Clostridium sp. C8-1-8]
MILDLNKDMDLIKRVYTYFSSSSYIYEKMYEYYKGNTDALANYKMVTSRSNNKISTNFIKKFIKEEMSYSFGNAINYTSNNGNNKSIKDIYKNTWHWSEKHDTDLAKNMLLYSIGYEIYYTDSNGFSSKVISPRNGYAYVDENNKVMFFIRRFTKQFDAINKIYIDIYDDKYIYHFDDSFGVQLADPDFHYFGKVPVGIAKLSDELQYDTIYGDIKSLQDAYETNLSDISNEISDFRQAYLKLTGVDITDEQATQMKEMGILKMKNKDSNADWLIKNINDTFIQNTLNTLEDKMYQLSSHINHNEKMQSNLSGVALRSRLISLEERCKLNQQSMTDCIKTRLQMLFTYLSKLNLTYDASDIKIKYTANIPQDDTAMADIVSKVGDLFSDETKASLFSFVDNPSLEIEKRNKEQEEVSQGNSLLDNAPVVGDNSGQV